jgi:chloramphenicol-sensitive protein RarD
LKGFKAVLPVEILAHRSSGSPSSWPSWMTPARNGRSLRENCAADGQWPLFSPFVRLIAVNWLLYIWAVNSSHLVETSLGYFINPLVNVLLGFLFLRERLNRPQTAAVILAGAGLLFLTWRHGGLPWIALGLAFSFGLYGLIKKVGALSATEGLTFETAVLSGPGLIFLVLLAASGRGAFGQAAGRTTLLFLSGVVTASPMILFAAAARRIPLATVGFLGYISPSLQFILGVLLYREPFDAARLVGFVIIWVALAVYSLDGGLAARRKNIRRAEAGL